MDSLRPMLGFHTHAHRHTRSVLAALFPSVALSHLRDEDVRPEAGHWESRMSVDTRASAALAEVMACAEPEVAVVAHFTTLYAMLMGAADARIFGARPGPDRRPLLDCSACPALARLAAEPVVSEAAVLSLVLVAAPPPPAAPAAPLPPPALPLERVCEALLLGEAGAKAALTSQLGDGAGLWHLFLAAAASTPHATALYGPGPATRLSYGELLMRVLRVVRRLRDAGAQPGAYVGVCAERGVGMAVAALAVLVSGCTYFAMHPSDPLARRQGVVALTRPAALLCTAATKSAASECGGEAAVVCVDEECAASDPALLLASLSAPPLSAVGYCTFTSGSSGPPKAVLLSHRALVHFTRALRAAELADGAGAAAFGAATRVLQLSRCSFDIAWFELVAPLCLGGAAVLLPPALDAAFAIETVADSVAAHGATWAFVVPAVARLLVEHLASPAAPRLPSLRTLCVGGELVTPALALALQRALPTARVVHGYGPAECTVFTTVHRFRPEADAEALPLGAPLPGYRVALIDDDTGREVGRGEIGTMYISGPAILDCYLRNEEATAAAVREVTIDGERVRAYCSGDLARRDASGALHYVGRRDRQVKLHGQRLELAGVEAAAAAHAAVRAVAVKKWSLPPDRQFLAAYVAWMPDALARASPAELERELRAELGRQLLAWMVPALVVSVSGDLPRNAHGKVDFNALPLPLAAAQTRPPRVCVIGGGVGGLLVAIEALRRGMDVRIIERAAQLGGVWSNGAASAHSTLQQPAEYYAVDGPLPSRFPAAPAVHAYLTDVATRHALTQRAALSAEVTEVTPSADGAQLHVTWRQHSATSTDAFDYVVCATGRFDPQRLVRPAWQPFDSAPAAPALVSAARLDPAACAGKRVVIVGGGPYAVEAVRLCVGGGAAHVSVVIRRPHWVFPRAWFASRALTRLFWRLCSGGGVPRRLALLCKVAVARHYLRAGLAHLLPAVALTDPKTAISDEFFAHARLPHVRYMRADVHSAAPAGLSVRASDGASETLPCDLVVVACGFERPAYPFLRRFAPLELYLGAWSIAQPRLCFVGVGLGEGVFPNPHTMRPQVDAVLNHMQHPACARTEAEMRAWLRGAQAADGEVRGAAAHMSEHLAELQHQRRALSRATHAPSHAAKPAVEGADGSVSEAVVRAAQGAGLHVGAHNLDDALVALGMDSLGAVRFRALLSRRFPDATLPNIGSLLWDFPTLGHIVRFLSAPTVTPPPVTIAGTTDSEVADVPPLLTPAEAEAYVLQELALPADVLALRLSDPVAFITRVCEAFHRTVPFQSFTLLHVDRACRRLPSLAQLKRDVYARLGGCCYVLNVFMRELLRAFGFHTYFARCAIHGVEDCHMTVVLRGLSPAAPSADLWLVDVGCGYVTPRPMHVAWGPQPESPVYEYGFLRLKWVRSADAAGAPLLLRLHAAASTFDERELTLRGQRADEFTHLFWAMSLRPRPMHDSGETQQVRAFVGYQKLRASIGRGPACRMVYFKADNDRGRLVASVQEDVGGALRGTPLSEEELLTRLAECFPMFSRESLAAAIQRVISAA